MNDTKPTSETINPIDEGAMQLSPGSQQEMYEIRVVGHLGNARSDWFDGLSITNLEGGEALISGPVADQAALHGLLAKVRDLNLKLVSVRKI